MATISMFSLPGISGCPGIHSKERQTGIRSGIILEFAG